MGKRFLVSKHINISNKKDNNLGWIQKKIVQIKIIYIYIYTYIYKSNQS